MLTTACPNRCKYCYIKDKGVVNFMSMDTLLSSIDSYKPDRIIFFGGEPLLELDKIKYVTDKLYGKTKLQVVTSTSANFKEFISDVYAKTEPGLFDLQVSWDGPDTNRINFKGENIAGKVHENIMMAADMLNYKRGFDVKCVISEDNVKSLTWLHNVFKYAFHSSGISGQFVIAHRTDATDEFFDTLESQLIKTFSLTHAYSMHLRMLMAHIYKDKSFKSCDVGKYTVIDPQGRESYCTALSQEGLNFSPNVLQEECYCEDCKNCRLAHLCDGGCRYERYKIFGAEWQNNHLKSTCRMVEIWEKCLIKWWDKSDQYKKRLIMDKINAYRHHLEEYYKVR